MRGWSIGGRWFGRERQGAAAAPRRCPSCGEARPATHAYCFADGARLHDRVVRANTGSYRPPRVPLSHPRIVASAGYPSPARWGRRLLRLAVEVPILLLALVGALSLLGPCEACGTVVSTAGVPVVDGARAVIGQVMRRSG
jgi:hypothetical protein